MIATAAPLRAADLDELLKAPDAFLVALDGVSDPRNLGAVARVAETAGATGLILPRHRSAGITPVVTKTAAGAIEYLPIVLTGGIPTALDRAPRRMLDHRARCGGGESFVVRSRARRPAPRIGARLRRSRSVPFVRGALRRAGVDSDPRFDRVAQRRGRRGTRVSRDRAPARGTTILTRAGLAQLAEQLTCNQQVVGSIPTPGSSRVP